MVLRVRAQLAIQQLLACADQQTTSDRAEAGWRVRRRGTNRAWLTGIDLLLRRIVILTPGTLQTGAPRTLSWVASGSTNASSLRA